jgi:predicted RNase H-like HicB family nuclease
MKTPTARIHGYDVTFEKSRTGYACYAPSLPGCASAGDNLTECKHHMAEAIEFHLAGLAEDGILPPPRDGRAAPRPHRMKGRTVAISSRVSPEAAKMLERISKAKGMSKTEVLETAIVSYGKRLRSLVG